MAHDRLLFHGQRLRLYSLTGQSGSQLITPVATRPWSIEIPSGLWRTFGEIDLLNELQVGEWLRSHGDLMRSDAEPPGTKHTVAEWVPLHAALKTAAAAWNTGSDGRDQVKTGSAECAAAIFALEQLPPPRVSMRGGLVPIAGSLRDYLHISSAIQLENKTPLRRCRKCSKWFDASHRAALFCSPACKVSQHRSMREIMENG